MRQLVAIGLAILVAAPVQAQFLQKRERVTVPVAPVSDQTFEVVRSSLSAPADIWCAAGAYAARVLGVRSGRLWVAQGLAPSTTAPGSKSMIFSLAPVLPEQTTYTYSLNTQGVVKSLAAARAACDSFDAVVFVRTSAGTFKAR